MKNLSKENGICRTQRFNVYSIFGNKGKFSLILAQTTGVLVKQQVQVTAGVTEGKLFL